jgi:speckle-type POZ protein
MAFAGVSLIADGMLSASTVSPIDARADRGYHLLVVEGFSHSKGAPPNGECIESRPFLVGGYRWRLDYYPNGFTDDDEEFISVILVPEEDLKAQEADIEVVFSFIDQPEFRMSPNFRKSGIPPHHCYVAKKLIKRDILERSRHLKRDSFIIRCDIIFFKAPTDASTDNGAGTTSSFVEMPPSDMQSHLGDLLRSKEGADITFEVDGQKFAAHRCVLAARSSVFREQLFGGTMTKKDVVEINDIKPLIFSDLLVFIYTGLFDWDWAEDEEDDSGEEEYVTCLLQTLEAADRYDLQRLKSICAEQGGRRLLAHIDQSPALKNKKTIKISTKHGKI